jgi:MOSC domain-containing protein YiiM
METPLAGRVVSVNVGTPREVSASDRKVLTSIYKSPVEGRVAARHHNLEGDRQSDLKVHGGPYKAVYLYPFEHYAYWAEQLPGVDLYFGAFGENLTTEGLTEESAHIGDRFRFGSAVLQVTQPRMPCFKLGIRFDRADMVQRFWRSRRSGIYFSIVEEGELGRGDAIEQVAAGPEQVSVADVVRLYTGEATDTGLLERALRTPLSGSWKEEIKERIGHGFPRRQTGKEVANSSGGAVNL